MPSMNKLTLSSPSVSASTANAAMSTTTLETALTKLRLQNDALTYHTALTTADKLLGNIIANVR